MFLFDIIIHSHEFSWHDFYNKERSLYSVLNSQFIIYYTFLLQLVKFKTITHCLEDMNENISKAEPEVSNLPLFSRITLEWIYWFEQLTEKHILFTQWKPYSNRPIYTVTVRPNFIKKIIEFHLVGTFEVLVSFTFYCSTHKSS